VKKAGYFILLLSLLGSVQTFSELMKAPLVLVHVLEHLVKDEQFSLTEFWEMHYISEPVMDEDFGKDQQLPFKSAHMPSHEIKDLFYPQLCQLQIRVSTNPTRKSRNFLADLWISTNYSENLWQPPKCS